MQKRSDTTARIISSQQESVALLSELILEFTVSLDRQQTLQNALARICEHLDAEAGSIFILEEDNLVCRISQGPINLTGLRIPVNQGIVGRTVCTGEITMVRDARKHSDFAAQVDAHTGFSTRSILCAPLMTQGTQLGAIELINKRGESRLFSEEDRELLIALASATSLAIHNTNMARALVKQERIQRELKLAREIQESLLPATKNHSLSVCGINIPATEVSGDFFDYFSLADGRICFSLGDVSGKGMNAALLMSKTSSLFHCLAKTIADPGELMSTLNAELCENATRGMFVTMVCGVLDPHSGRTVLANAGHPPPLLQDASGSFYEINGNAPPLGIVTNQLFETQTVELSNGLLVLYSDGITESRLNVDSTFGVTGLKEVLAGSEKMMLDTVFNNAAAALKEISDWAHDDMTLLFIKGMTPGQELVDQFSMEARPELLKSIRRRIAKSARACGFDNAAIDNIVLSVDEACTNIIRHAYNSDPNGLIRIKISRNAGEMIIQLDDDAKPVLPGEIHIKSPKPDQVGGLGLKLINKIMDSTELHPASRQGNSLTMRKRLP